jgi:Calcineurin-like phosphoesterase
MAAPNLPVLIVGDVHGDLQRLFRALRRYPASDWHTIFLGDLVDYGVFGVGALRFARDRPNTDVLLGNHEVAMLWALRDPARVGWWISIGGQLHDLEELRKDELLQLWLRTRPLVLKLDDGTLIQHCGSDVYEETNLFRAHHEPRLWELLSGPNVFEEQRARLERYLDIMKARRVVFGHKPRRGPKPAIFHDGAALNFEGAVAPLPA